jgi:hypothetical protein
MRRTWPIPVGIALLGALAGIAIAGQPVEIGTFVVDAVTETSTSISPVVTLAPTTSQTPGTVDVPTVPTAPPATTGTPTTIVASTTSTATPTSTTSNAPTTTTGVTTTTITTVAPGHQTLDRADVRLVIANGDGRFNLAGRNGGRLAAAGYTQIDLEDAAKVPATVLYYRPGFDDEAAIVAADLSIPDALLQPLPDTPITANDSLGDIIVVLGPDALR